MSAPASASMLQRNEVADLIAARLGWRPSGMTLHRLMSRMPGSIGGRRADGQRGGYLRVPAASVDAWIEAQRGGSGSETGAEVVTGDDVASAQAA